MKRKHVYVDTETTGLEPSIHWAYEAAWAVDDERVRVCHLPHSLEHANPESLAIGRYDERGFYPHEKRTQLFTELRKDLTGAVLVAANPAFDAAFLCKAIGFAPWHYRLFDIEAYAAGIFDWDEPRGLRDIRAELLERGVEVTMPDHTAEADVIALRECHRSLRAYRQTLRAA
jgi:hypothetical protein